MPLPRDFRETIRDRKFRKELLQSDESAWLRYAPTRKSNGAGQRTVSLMRNAKEPR